MNIYEAIADIMKKGYAIAKDSTNTQQGFKYRGIDAVMNTFQPLMANAGIFVVPEVLEQTREERKTAKGNALIYSVLKVKYTFYAADGTSVSATVIGEGMDSGDKASNKALAVAMKYAMFQVFCIPTEEMVDPDAECHDVAPKDQPKEKPAERPTFKCAKCGKDIVSYFDKSGKPVSLRQHAEVSQRKFGAVYCLECIPEIKAAKGAD